MQYAHLPTGYIISDLLFRRFRKSDVSYKTFIFSGMIGAIAPDFDMIYFFFKDHVLHHTHRFYSHYPFVWFSLLLISLLWMLFNNYQSQNPALAVIFTLNGFFHLILDTIEGQIYWLARPGTVGHSFGIEPYIPWTSASIELFILLGALCLWSKKLIIHLYKIIDDL
jgi:LexA-binding, inner membrane-associated putative hydrolase